jgi:hypothetical protein
LLVIYTITLGIRIYWLNQKEGFEVDEGLSITLACYNDYMWTANYEFNREYSGKEVKEISLCDNDRIKNVFGDIYRLWQDNRDSPHTNFYYSLLRISLAGLKTGDIKVITFRAGILNCILFTISFFSLFLLTRLLFKENKAMPYLAVFCAFASTASLSNTLFFRPYQLQETLFIIFAYFFVLFIHRRKYILFENTLYLNFYTVFVMAFIASLTLLTGYYAVLFVGLFGIYIVYRNIKMKNQKEILVYIIIFAAALCFAQVFYSQYLSGFFSYRSQETLQTIWHDGFLENIVSTAVAIISLLHKYFFNIPVIILIAVLSVSLFLTKQKPIFNELTLLLFLVPFVYIIVITYIAPYKSLRYSMAVFPFLVILPVSVINSLKNKYISRIAATLLCVLFSINAFHINNIENVCKGKPEQYLFNKEKTVPVLVIGKETWKYANIVPYFNDEQIYIFNDNFDRIMAHNRYAEIYLAVEKTESENIILTNYEIESAFEVGYYTCWKLKKRGRE